MPSYLYGLILSANASRVPPITGIDSADVRVVLPAAGVLAGIVSDLARAPDRGNLDDVRAHDDVLRAMVSAGVTAVASRFGQSFDDDEALRAAVADAGDRVVGALEAFDGAVEMRILLAADPAAVAPPTRTSPDDTTRAPGRAYLEQLRARIEPPAVSLRPALGPMVRAERVEQLAAGRGVAFAHLVARADIDAYRKAVAALPAFAGATVVGPLALYSFTGPSDD